MSCEHGYHFKREYFDCTGQCLKAAAIGAPVLAEVPSVSSDGEQQNSDSSISFVEWQRKGWDAGSVVSPMPDADGIIAMARKLLQV